MSNPWREASTLILVTRASIAQKVVPDLSQTLMVTSRVVQSSDDATIKASKEFCKTDYRVLMVKRSKLSSFMASAYVFPGGQVEVADFSPKWYQVFEKAGFSRDKLCEQMKQITGSRASILQSPLVIKDNFKANDDFILPEIGLRISAIRETFEETGVALFRNEPNKPNTSIDLSYWREKMRNDGNAFLELCLQFNKCPDIWSLYEWWNWLTPISVGHKRFDTMFYICCLEQQPDVVLDNTEVTKLKWCTPKQILMEHKQEEVFLAPPQAYELARLDNFSDFKSIFEFAQKREKLGVERWMPVIYTYADGALSLLPQDDLYPQDPDFVGLKPVPDFPQTLDEMRLKFKNFNRIELRGPVCSCICTCKLSCGHPSPKTYPPQPRL